MNALDQHLAARVPVVLLVTHEEDQVVADLRLRRPTWSIHTWTCTHGLDEKEPTGDPEAILKRILEDQREDVVYVLHDFHAFLKNYEVCRRVRALASRKQYVEEGGVRRAGIGLVGANIHVVLTSPRADSLPEELRNDVPVIEFERPVRDRLQVLAATAAKEHPSDAPQALATALSGLTFRQARNALALAVADTGEIRVSQVLKAKARILAADVPGLEIVTPDVTLDDVAGLDALVAWIKETRAVIQDPEGAKAFGLPAPRGAIFCGPPGTGKSLVAKAMASGLGLGLLRLDLGAVMGSLVGASEGNIRKALRVAEAMAPAVLWVDEIEKAVSQGQVGGGGDSGTSSRVIGTLLTWLAEKTVPIFLVVTSNKPEILPPELLRKGRFDEMFCLDLPNDKAREDILRVHLKKRNRDPKTFDLKQVAAAMDGFSGAEVEAVVVAALRKKFVAGEKGLTATDLVVEATLTVPLSRSMSEQIEGMRSWARGRARDASGTRDNAAPTTARSRPTW